MPLAREARAGVKIIIGWLTCRPGTRAGFLSAMAPHSLETLREPGCEFFEYHERADDPDGVVLIEGFRDAAAHEFHRRTPHMVAMQAEVRTFLTHVKLVYLAGDDVSREELDFVTNPPSPYRP